MRSPFPYDSYPGPDPAAVDPCREALPSPARIKAQIGAMLDSDPDQPAADLYDEIVDWAFERIYQATGRQPSEELDAEIRETIDDTILSMLGDPC